MQEEFDQFEKNKVCELIPKPPNASIVGTKWVYKNKLNEYRQVTISDRRKKRVLERHDIMFSVCKYARYQSAPKESYLTAVKRSIRYLIRTIDYRLWYESLNVFDLKDFSDTNFAGDKIDRKNTSGTCQLLGKSLISWHNKKQGYVALSTTEAEYLIVGNYCTQVLWIMHQLLDYDLRLNCFPIMCDNTSAICLSKNYVHHSRA
ncbi:secreted RxLR effector protein 161-like [Nicotiana tomentosiformis]|uniref:secreted RxLR effector protein 161-like n=1 Tax=Nicotiana tomentosiformis TaxID=4098 RepID=UPI00388C4377